MASPWLSFKQENGERWEALHDGVPEWIKESVVEWLRLVYVTNRTFNRGRIRAIEVSYRISLKRDFDIDTDSGEAYFFASVESLLNRDDQGVLLAFLDVTVQFIRSQGDDFMAIADSSMRSKGVLNMLDGVLKNGSKWTVVYEPDAESGLVERVNNELTQKAKELHINALTKAWNEAFGVRPNPERAVENAQKAIEITASQAGLTNAKTSVYGNLLGDIEVHPDQYISAAAESFGLQDKLAKKPMEINEKFAKWFADGMDLIQKTNPGRHSSTATDGFALQPDAAQQAVLTATVLCYLIQTKSFIKKDKTKAQLAP